MTTAAVGAVAAAVALTLGVAPPAHARLQPDAAGVECYVRATYPEIHTIRGERPDDEDPDHPNGRAVDIMIPAWDTPEGEALGNRIGDDLQGQPGRFGISYIIWRQTYRPPYGPWRPMANRGGPTANHLDHVHVSTYGNAGTEKCR